MFAIVTIHLHKLVRFLPATAQQVDKDSRAGSGASAPSEATARSPSLSRPFPASRYNCHREGRLRFWMCIGAFPQPCPAALATLAHVHFSSPAQQLTQHFSVCVSSCMRVFSFWPHIIPLRFPRCVEPKHICFYISVYCTKAHK